MTEDEKFDGERAAKIRALNDRLRSTGQGGSVNLAGSLATTAGVDPFAIMEIAWKTPIASGDDFYAEHDFGTFDYQGREIIWKIDYYDQSLARHSPDAADPSVTVRVLTFCYAEDY